MEANVSEVVLPPSSLLKYMVKEMYQLHFCLPIEVPKDGGSTVCETVIYSHHTTRLASSPTSEPQITYGAKFVEVIATSVKVSLTTVRHYDETDVQQSICTFQLYLKLTLVLR
jgi:hypothetical protein